VICDKARPATTSFSHKGPEYSQIQLTTQSDVMRQDLDRCQHGKTEGKSNINTNEMNNPNVLFTS